MCGPAVNNRPHRICWSVALLVESVDGIETAAGGCTAVLGVLGEGHSPLHSVSGDNQSVQLTTSIDSSVGVQEIAY